MSSSNDNSRPDPVETARAALADALGTTDLDIVAGASGRMPSGEEVRLVHGAVHGQPNRTASVAVDSSGGVHPRRRLEALAGRDLFAARPPVATERPAETPAAPVTVDPPTNDLVLPECVTEQETVTVHVPPSGVRPKADIYLLADTTGSMGTILDAVKTGIASIVNDGGLAPFDLAWGVGNYKDFPVPASSPYAFEHQLAPTPGVAAVSLAVMAWTASGGVDTPESNLFALHQVATDPAIGWRSDRSSSGSAMHPGTTRSARPSPEGPTSPRRAPRRTWWAPPSPWSRSAPTPVLPARSTATRPPTPPTTPEPVPSAAARARPPG